MTSQSSYISVTDLFCGAGGSSIGATRAGGELTIALNHWKVAIESHNSNFPDAYHECTDIQACNPARYLPTTILIAGPECVNHTVAKGKARKHQAQLQMFGQPRIDPAEERSRATMWDVCRFAEAHGHLIVIVENVVEARMWALFPAWLQAMELLGYRHKIVYLNSMFAHPTPQSRDRMYVVFWKKSLRTPNLDIRPAAHCASCGRDVAAVQSWKQPQKPWGKYGQQYVYRCPLCAQEVIPYYFAAANAIDWSLPAPRIGDRKRQLKEKTRARIAAGLKKYAGRSLLVANYSPGWARPVDGGPTGTVTTTDHHALVAAPPFLVETKFSHAGNARTRGVDGPTPTQTAQQTQALVMPPLLVNLEHGSASGVVRSVAEAHPTQTSAQANGLVVPPLLVSLNHSSDQVRDVGSPLPTTMPQGNPALVLPPVLIDLRGQNVPKDAAHAPLSTVCATGNHHGLCFLTSYYNNGGAYEASTETVPTVTGVVRCGLVQAPPFVVSYYTRRAGQQEAVASLEEALPTVPGRAVHYLAQPGEEPDVEQCGFRMLQPHEIGAAMAFPQDYVVVGNQRQRVRQYGNAVTPPVMELLVRRCLEVLG